MLIISEPTIYESWRSILKAVLEKGRLVEDEKDPPNKTREVINLFTTIENPLDERDFDKFPLTKKQMDKFADSLLIESESKKSGFIPGKRLYNFSGINQLETVREKLKKIPNTRRASVILCDPSRDWNTKRPPSLLLIDFKLREGKLHLTAVIRSNDMYRTWPANAYSLAKLLKTTCEEMVEISVAVGTLNILSTSAHIYEEDVEEASKFAI